MKPTIPTIPTATSSSTITAHMTDGIMTDLSVMRKKNKFNFKCLDTFLKMSFIYFYQNINISKQKIQF